MGCAFGHWWFQSSISVSGSLHSVVYLGYTCEYEAARREWCEWMRRGRHGMLHGNRDEDACRDRSSFSSVQSVQWFRALFFLHKAQHTSQLAAHDVMLTMFTVFWLDVCNGLLFWHAGFLCCLCAGVRSSFS